jgi:hypothetical protein
VNLSRNTLGLKEAHLKARALMLKANEHSVVTLNRHSGQRNSSCVTTRLTELAEAAHCARSTVAEAIKVLEDAGVLSWVQRIKRVRVRCPDLFGTDGVRVVPQRTSNAYHFNDPCGVNLGASYSASAFTSAPKSEKPTGTPNQGFFSSLVAAFGGKQTARFGRKEAFEGEIART